MTRMQSLPRCTPEALGVSSSAVLAFLDAVESQSHELHSLMFLRQGQVFAEGWWSPYAPEHPHALYSLSKSFTSTAVGLAVAEGRLSVSDPVLSFFPDLAPAEVSENLAKMQVRHALMMGTGHAQDMTAIALQAGIEGLLAQPVEYAPGTHFVYNSAASYLLAAIVERVTGEGLLNYLQPRLFEPLGIAHPTWETCPRGIAVGGWGLSITTEDIAHFGQLYLQKGLWQGKRLLSEAWVAEATTAHISNGDNPESDWAQGYGYQFWRCRQGAYRGDGAFGQYCVVLPAQEAVVAITSGVGDLQAILNLVWTHLLPAYQSAPLPADPATHTTLQQRLAALALPLLPCPEPAVSPPALSGVRYRFEPNDAQVEGLSLTFAGDTCTLTIQDGRGEHRIVCGSGQRHAGQTTFDPGGEWRIPPPHLTKRVAAQGVWTDAETYTMQLCFYETPYRVTLTCRFTGDTVTFDHALNVAFGPNTRPPLTGHRA